ncbi:hypothetical protein B1987_14060 [Mycobacterium kansasii]|nr:hypothetical protein B1987_14060 [Mycobacterium kansasii]
MRSNVSTSNTNQGNGVDVRGTKFGAWVSTAVLVISLIISGFSPPAAAVVLTLQAFVFAIGALNRPRWNPYGLVFAAFVAPRLGPVAEREPLAPVKFANLVGFVMVIPGAVGFAAGIRLLGVIATATLLAAVYLNAAFGFCIGCRLFPLVASPKPASQTAPIRLDE